MWQKVEPARKRSDYVSITPQKTNGAINTVSLLIPPKAWQGERPREFDLFVDIEAQAMRVQEGSSYVSSPTKGQPRIRLSCMQALKALGIPAPTATIALPCKWHDGGLEIDLSQWRRE